MCGFHHFPGKKDVAVSGNLFVTEACQCLAYFLHLKIKASFHYNYNNEFITAIDPYCLFIKSPHSRAWEKSSSLQLAPSFLQNKSLPSLWNTIDYWEQGSTAHWTVNLEEYLPCMTSLLIAKQNPAL